MRIVADANIPYVAEAFGRFGEVVTLDKQEIAPATVRDAEILLVRSETRVAAELLEGSRVRFVGSATSGIDHVDLEYLKARGITFAHAAGSNANSVAEYVVAALLVLAERFDFSLQGKRLGVVGVGHVGTRVVHMAKTLGLHVLQNDPPKARISGARHFRVLEELMDVDMLTLHVPLTVSGRDATYHLFDAARLAKLNSGCIVINTARGPVVETAALKSALLEGRLKAAVLDVWENEPDIDVELLSLATLGTPHIAGYSLDGKVAATQMLFQAVNRFLGETQPWPELSLDQEVQKRVLHVEPKSGTREAVLLDAVRQVYDIQEDDRRLRAAMAQPAEVRGKEFTRLRRTYGVRREFSSTRVSLTSKDAALTRVFAGLGFDVREG
ncbi:MAG: 4-phosphoerythronate dehydrogenase [Calditrichaeota bacterium]|nr:MAG: 4-phosphoerythronate dehydrogenase [Calditrichota bacterium]